MASISSLTNGSSSSSIYGTRNVISGLASGLDTEALIENMVSGYETKLTKLQQEKTQTEWKQESYRSMISKISSFLGNYCTYSSSTNLMSKSFYTNSVNVQTNGAYASMISASGKTTSDVKVLGVKQLATADTYTIDGTALKELLGKGTAVAWNNDSSGRALAGATMSVTLDGVTKTITLEDGTGMSAEEYAEAIQGQIDKAFGEGKLDVSVSETDDKVQFSFNTTDKTDGSTFKVSSDSSVVQNAMGVGASGVTNYLDVANTTLGNLLGSDMGGLAPTGKKDADGNDYYALTINGVTVGENYTKNTSLETLMSDINNSDAGVTVSYSKTTNKLTFAADETGAASNIDFGTGGLAAALFGGKGERTEGQDAILTMEVNGKRLEDVVRSGNSFNVDGMTINLKGTFGYTEDNRVEVAEGIYESADYDTENAPVVELNGKYYTLNHQYINEDGEYVTEDGTTYKDIIAGLPYTLTGVAVDNGKFLYEDAEGNVITDAAQQTDGNKLVAGTEAVTFSSSVDADKIISAVKKMIEDYNAMATEIKQAYSTMPEQKSNGDYYTPLTDEDKSDMSEYAIKEYEEKAKTGLLFGDRDLSNLYSMMLNSLNAADLESIGISQSYNDGLTTLTLDEDKLTEALESDADHVYEVLGGEKGLATSLKKPLEMYGKTTGTKGILVEKAGSTLSPTSLYTNEIYHELQDLDDEIEKWQDYINEQIDHYTSKFTYLEQLIAELNNQSSMIASLGG